ncbi:hypothetical protein D3C80_1869420 [compost metagenome]
MGSDVDHYIELFPERVGLGDAGGEIGVVELVVAHPQAVAWLAGVDGIGAIGEGVAQAFQGAGGGEQFGLVDNVGHG